MIASIIREAANHGDKAAAVPIHRLNEIRQDFEALISSGELNNFQRFIVNDLYALEVPEVDFEIRSIVIVATPSPPAIRLHFQRQGQRIQTVLPASYAGKDTVPVRVEHYLNEALNPQGYRVLYAPKLPHKRLAVRSGLGAYGKNNICYVEGMGSFLNLNPFYSDVPCAEDPWQEVRQMDVCRTCRACLHNCPTGAILPTQFLIDNERCLTYFNEAGAEWNFPDWIDPAAHHTLYGCMRCQTICPANQPYLNRAVETMEFTEEETLCLMEHTPYEQFPEALRHKVNRLGAQEYLGAIPRNLQAIFNQGV